MAQKNGCIILKKGSVDIISDGERIKTNKTHNQGMTKGGTGDILAGLLAALACKNDSFEAAVAAARINGTAGNMLMKKYGFNYCASDLAQMLSEAASVIR
jgi:NAD(P)H-hydrate epimerase